MKLTSTVRNQWITYYREHPTDNAIRRLARAAMRTRVDVIRVLELAGVYPPAPKPRTFHRPPRPQPTEVIGARIAHIRDLLGLTLKQFGRAIHRTEGFACILEKGYHAKIGAEVLVHLAILGFRPIWVLEGSGDLKVDPGGREWPREGCYLPPRVWPLVLPPRTNLPIIPVPPFRSPSYRPYPVSAQYQARLDGKLACRFCGARIQPQVRQGGSRDICDRPTCETRRKRESYATSYAKKTAELGFAPCRACWKNPLPAEGTRCPECQKKSSSRYREIKQDRQQLGLCMRCDNPRKHEDYLCHMHREEALTLWETTIGQRIWKALAALALMTPEQRATYSKAYQHRRYLRFKRRGKCYRCGCPKDPEISWPACPQHHQQQNLSKRLCWRRNHPVPTSPAKVEGDDDRGGSHEAGVP